MSFLMVIFETKIISKWYHLIISKNIYSKLDTSPFILWSKHQLVTSQLALPHIRKTDKIKRDWAGKWK